MAKKSPRRKAPKKARKMEDLPTGNKAKDVKGGRLTESISFAYEKIRVGY